MAKPNESTWQKLFDELVVLARQKLGNLPRQVKNAEDIANSAIKSYFGGVERGRFELPEDEFSLWPLLSIIVARKCADLAAKGAGMNNLVNFACAV